jgi:hypothetical protein
MVELLPLQWHHLRSLEKSELQHDAGFPRPSVLVKRHAVVMEGDDADWPVSPLQFVVRKYKKTVLPCRHNSQTLSPQSWLTSERAFSMSNASQSLYFRTIAPKIATFCMKRSLIGMLMLVHYCDRGVGGLGRRRVSWTALPSSKSLYCSSVWSYR